MDADEILTHYKRLLNDIPKAGMTYHPDNDYHETVKNYAFNITDEDFPEFYQRTIIEEKDIPSYRSSHMTRAVEELIETKPSYERALFKVQIALDAAMLTIIDKLAELDA